MLSLPARLFVRCWPGALATLTACGAGGATSPTPTPTPPTPAAPSLRIEVVGFGNARDADGFTITVGSVTTPLPFNGVVTLTSLPAGEARVNIGGVAPHCEADSAFVRRTLVAGRADSVRFVVGCFGDVAYTAFTGSDLHVFYMDTLGAVRQLTNAPGRQEGVKWSPDGRRLLYLTSEASSNPTNASIYSYEIATILPDGSSPRFLGAGTVGANNARWSPDGRQIAYNRYPFNTSTAILQVVDTNGANNLQLFTPIGSELEPDWILGGARLAFGCARSPVARGLCSALSNGDSLRALDSTVSGVSKMSASPNGQSVAFEAIVNQQQAVLLASAVAPGPSRVLLPGVTTYGVASWSPDGTRLAVNTVEGTSFGVRVVGADGTGGTTNQTAFSANVGPASWSTDGAWLNVSAVVSGVQYLYAVATDGSGVQRINTPQASPFNPQWRPGSRFVRRP